MDLLTTAQKALIQQGLLDAMNTNHQSSITLLIRGQSLDIMQSQIGAIIQYTLKTIVKEKRQINQEGVEGSRDINRIETKFHINDFQLLGLVALDGSLLFTSSNSSFIYKGEAYRITSVIQEDIAVRIEAESNPISR